MRTTSSTSPSWLEEVGIDGWRLDVAHEIEPDFWREFRAVCDSVDKDCLLVGEMIRGNGDDRPTAVLGHQLPDVARHARSTASSRYLAALLREQHSSRYPGELLGNHDLPRIASNLDNRTTRDGRMLLMKGIPCLYYGDEFGMEGTPADGTDEHNGSDDMMRHPMPDTDKPRTWPAVGVSRPRSTKARGIRKDHPVFSSGKPGHQEHQPPEPGVAVREITVLHETEEVGILVFNCADHEVNNPEVQLPPNFIAKKAPSSSTSSRTRRRRLVNDGGKVRGTVRPNSVKVLLYEKPKPKPPPPPRRAPVAGAIPGTGGGRGGGGSCSRAAAAAAAAAPAYDPAAGSRVRPAAYAACKAAQADAAAAAAAMAARAARGPLRRAARAGGPASPYAHPPPRPQRRPRTIPRRAPPAPEAPRRRSLARRRRRRRGGGGAGGRPPPTRTTRTPRRRRRRRRALDQWKNDGRKRI